MARLQNSNLGFLWALPFLISGCFGSSLKDVDNALGINTVPTGSSPVGDVGSAALSFSPASVAFGNVAVGSSAGPTVVTVTNVSSVPANVTSVSGGNTHFSVSSSTCIGLLSPTASCSINVSFAPLTGGDLSAIVSVNYTLTVEPSSVSVATSFGVTGTGISPLVFAGVEDIVDANVTASTVPLTWTHVAGALFYNIFRIGGDGSTNLVTSVSAPTASYVVPSLSAGTTYTFRVNAVDALGRQDSNVVDEIATTSNPGTFTAISDVISAEGATSYSAALSCTDQYANTAAFSITNQTDTDGTCTLATAPDRVRCDPAYKTGHSAWSSTITVRCTLNAKTYDRTFDLNVIDTNRAPDLTALSNQIVTVTNAITQINVQDATNDTDADLDAILYSCAFTKDGGASTACSQAALTGTFSFNTSTGVMDWTPAAGAVTGENNSTYSFTITASDQRPSPLTDTVSVDILVKPKAPQLTTIDDYTFIGSNGFKTVGDTLSIDINNIRDGSPGNDTSMSYTCTFDKTVDDAVVGGTNCSSLPGTVSFNTSTAALSWLTNFKAFGPYEIKIEGTHSVSTLSDDEIFVVDVRPAFTTTGLLSDWDAQFGDGKGLPVSTSTWRDNTGSYNGLLGTLTSGGWTGTGIYSSPHALNLDGTENANFGAALTGQATFAIHTWVKPTSPTTANKVILNNGANGLTIKQASDGSGKVEVYVGTEVTSYADLVLKSGPRAYYRFGEASGSATVDSSGNDYHGTYSGSPTFGQVGPLSGEADSAITMTASEFVNLSSTSAVPPVGTGISICVWANPSTLSGDGYIFSTGTTVGSNYLYFARASRRLLFGGAAGYIQPDGTFPSSTGLWNFYCGTYDGSTISVYRDAILIQASSGITLNWGTNLAQLGGSFLSHTNFAGSLDDLAIWPRAISQNEMLALYNAGINRKFNCKSANILASGTWNLLSAIRTGSTMDFYINGRSECSFTPVSGAPETMAGNIYAGSTNSSTNFWTGAIADIKTYVSQTAIQVSSYFSQTANRFRAQATHTLYNSSQVFLLDAANSIRGLEANANASCGTGSWSILGSKTTSSADGILNGFNCNASSGWQGTGIPSDPYRLAFDGTDDRLNTSVTMTALGVSGTVSRSFELWFRHRGNPTGSDSDSVFHIGSAGNSNDIFRLLHSNVANKWFIYPNWSNGAATTVFIAPSSENTWQHFLISYDGTTLNIYANGSLVGSNVVALNLATTATLALGVQTVTPSDFFTGDISYFAIYSQSFAQPEASALCNALKDRFSGAVCN